MPPIQVSPPPGKVIASDIWTYSDRHLTLKTFTKTDTNTYTMSGGSEVTLATYGFAVKPGSLVRFRYIKFKKDAYIGGTATVGSVYLKVADKVVYQDSVTSTTPVTITDEGTLDLLVKADEVTGSVYLEVTGLTNALYGTLTVSNIEIEANYIYYEKP